MFYDKFVEMCNIKKVTRTKACTDCGVSRTAWHKWESGATPNGATLSIIAAYFGVSSDYLLGKEEEKTPQPEGQDISDNDIKFALFGDTDIDDDSFEDVKRYAQFIAERKRKKEKK